MNVTEATRKRQTEGIANIFKASVNVTVLHTLPSSSMKLAPKLKPARIVLESLPQDLQDHIAGHTATMINLFNEVKKRGWKIQVQRN